MAPDQLSLAYDAPRTRGASRQHDPHTSQQAGRTVNTQRQRDQILRLLRGSVEGLTADELAAQMFPQPHRSTVASRLSQMRADGLCEPFGVRVSENGRHAQVWFAKVVAA